MEKKCLLPVYISYGLLVISRASSECVTSVCEPAEEGTRHTITFALSLEYNLSIDISADDIPAGTCYVNKSCSNLFPNRYNISRSQNKAFELVEVTIYNVTKQNSKTNKVWFMAIPSQSYHNKKCECLQTVFTRATDSACSKLISDDGINVTCFTNKVYPPAKCRLLLRINNTIIDTPAETSYKHETLPGNATYFASNCTISVPKTNLSPGVYAMAVTMYPNITNNDTDAKYGRNLSMSFILEVPRVLISQCPKVVDERSNVTCVCTEKNSLPVSVDLRWYDPENKMFTTSNVIHFVVNRRQSGFYCQAHTAFGWRSEKVFCNISVLYLDSVLLTVNDQPVKNNIVLEPNSSFVILCEAMGNPDPVVKLYNGRILIAQSIKSVDVTNTSTCNSPSVFTCTAVQENKLSSASVNVYTKCPLQFRSTEKQPVTIKVYCKIHQEIKIILDIYGYPKPIRYYIVKNDAIMTRFNNVSEGNACEDGNLIQYNENGTLTLTLKCPSGNERPHYVFNLDNGISPALNYSFYVDREIVANQQSLVLYRRVISSGVVSSLIIVSLMVVVCYCCKRTDKRNNPIKQGADSYVELIYEDINDEDETNARSSEYYNNYGYEDNETPVVLEIRRNSGGRLDDTVMYSSVGEERTNNDCDEDLVLRGEVSDEIMGRGFHEDDTCGDEEDEGDDRLYAKLEQPGKGGKRLIRRNLYDTLQD